MNFAILQMTSAKYTTNYYFLFEAPFFSSCYSVIFGQNPQFNFKDYEIK